MMRLGKAKAKASVDMAVADVWRRELGELSNRKFANRLAASEDLMLRLDVSRKYVKDQSCADGMAFNAAGNILVNGLADKRIVMRDWESGIVKFCFNSGHDCINNLFVVKLMPCSNDRSWITCSADGQDLVLRLDISHKYIKDQSCADSVSFNAAGNILVNGLADKRVTMWDWEAGIAKLTFKSGHGCIVNSFVAKIIPHTGDRHLITCSAEGQVRHAQISDHGVKTRMVANHMVGAFGLALEPGSPNVFYSCGGDGLVNHIDLRIYAPAAKLFKCQPIDDHEMIDDFISLSHIAVDPMNPNLFAVSGSDKYTRLYDIRKFKRDGSTDFDQPIGHFYPPHLIGVHQMVTGMAFSDQSELLVSYGDRSVCLFTRDMGLGHNPVPSSPFSARSEAIEKAVPQLYKGFAKYEWPKCVSFFGPKSEYVVVGTDSGRIFIWKKKGGELVRVIEADKRIVHFIESHPQTGVLVSSGTCRYKIWTAKAIDKAVLPTQTELDKQQHAQFLFLIVISSPLEMYDKWRC
ncbi:hypothetical protein V6N13_122097 [Hibiscus sabdariffa]